jgi:hypothetical protein
MRKEAADTCLGNRPPSEKVGYYRQRGFQLTLLSEQPSPSDLYSSKCLLVGSPMLQRGPVRTRILSMRQPAERFPFSPIAARPRLDLPRGKRIAVYLIVNVEVWDFDKPAKTRRAFRIRAKTNSAHPAPPPRRRARRNIGVVRFKPEFLAISPRRSIPLRR